MEYELMRNTRASREFTFRVYKSIFLIAETSNTLVEFDISQAENVFHSHFSQGKYDWDSSRQLVLDDAMPDDEVTTTHIKESCEWKHINERINELESDSNERSLQVVNKFESEENQISNDIPS